MKSMDLLRDLIKQTKEREETEITPVDDRDVSDFRTLTDTPELSEGAKDLNTEGSQPVNILNTINEPKNREQSVQSYRELLKIVFEEEQRQKEADLDFFREAHEEPKNNEPTNE